MWQVSGFLRVLCSFLQQLKWPPRYSWNIAESGIKNHNPNLPCNMLLCAILFLLTGICNNTSNVTYICITMCFFFLWQGFVITQEVLHIITLCYFFLLTCICNNTRNVTYYIVQCVFLWQGFVITLEMLHIHFVLQCAIFFSLTGICNDTRPGTTTEEKKTADNVLCNRSNNDCCLCNYCILTNVSFT